MKFVLFICILSFHSQLYSSESPSLNTQILQAQQGDTDAQYELGSRYRWGDGVKLSSKQAASWYTKAAVQGHPAAQTQLGRMYQRGAGVEQSFESAVIWFRKAAVQGHAEAQIYLSKKYYAGQGVQKSVEQALYWALKAAEQGEISGHISACFIYMIRRENEHPLEIFKVNLPNEEIVSCCKMAGKGQYYYDLVNKKLELDLRCVNNKNNK